MTVCAPALLLLHRIASVISLQTHFVAIRLATPSSSIRNFFGRTAVPSAKRSNDFNPQRFRLK
jgi:hypothetical protein